MTKISDLLIPTERAQIEWAHPERADCDRPSVIVYWRPELDSPPDCEGWIYLRAELLGRAVYSDGACWTAWGKHGRSDDYFGHCIPEHIFAGILAECHHPDPNVWKPFYWETVRQFARIKGCPWARRMLEQKKQRALTRDDLRPYAVLPDGRAVRLPMGPFKSPTRRAA
jgi:hypothetical protein